MLQTNTTVSPLSPFVWGGQPFLCDDFINTLKNHYQERLHSVILFGSRARGDYTDDSDVDVAVILNDKKIKRFAESDELISITFNFHLDNLLLYQFYVMSVTEWEEEEEPIIYNIKNEGILLYDGQR